MSVDGPPASGSLPHLQAPSLVGEVLDGRYRIVRKLGEGGMGEVYAAEHIHIEKRFAIKLLRPEIVSNAEAVQRFRQEARSSSSIGHRNIIAIEDFGQLPDGRIYMCMELLNGAALNDLLQTPLTPDRMLNIMIQTGHGLAAAHAKNIVHRDMKPENIFVTIGPNNEDVPKILDFGIAKVSGNDGQNNLTRTGTIFGTPFYMAPEQALGNAVDARTDVYAMGVIMYEVFAGTLPFQGESFMGILTQHITTDPEPVEQRAGKAGRVLPVGLAEVITRCLQKNPTARFQTMDELVNALVAIYRSVAGAGMSTYMEAFPVNPTGAHIVAPTPPPMTGPVQVAAQVAPTAPPYGGPGSGQAPAAPAPYAGPGSAPYAGPGSAPVPVVAAATASSSVPALPPKKSKLGLIIAILVVLGGGAAAAIVLLGQSDDAKSVPEDPNGSAAAGSATAGSATVATNGSSQGTTNGSATVATNGSNQGTTEGSGSGTTEGSGSGTTEGSAGSGSGTVAGTTEGSGGTDTPPPVDAGVIDEPPPPPRQVEVLIKPWRHLSFEVYDEEGKKLFAGVDNVLVTPGTPRTLTIKAHGYKDKVITVDGKSRKLEFKLDKRPTTPVGPGSNTVRPPPPQLDCRHVLHDPRDRACRAQFCPTHKDNMYCGLE